VEVLAEPGFDVAILRGSPRDQGTRRSPRGPHRHRDALPGRGSPSSTRSRRP